ncbi:MAG TPA: HK97 family phage prohead protease [Dehalococcoidia bacterium]|jgi:HK97 family phage prohead protease|nr:HK97 family phage prohead protease [Dehalococcoidia bacterium]
MSDTTRFIFRSGPGPDRNGFKTDMEGWRLEAYKKNPVILFAHNDHALPIGRATAIGIENEQLVAEVEFAPTDQDQEVKKLVDQGFILGTSVGFRPIEFEFMRDEKHVFPIGIHSHVQELLELSVVPIPADSNALKSALGPEGPAYLKLATEYNPALHAPTFDPIQLLTSLQNYLRSR